MKLYQYIWRTTKGYRLRFLLLFVTVMAATAAEAMIPAVIGGIVDQIFYLRSLKGFLLCFFWYAGIYLFNQTMHGCLNYLWAKLKVTYVVDIRRECFDHLLRLKSERLEGNNFFGLTIKNIAPELLFGYNIENSRNETEQEAFP